MITSRFDASMNGAVFLTLMFALFMFGLYIFEEVRVYGYRTRAKAAVSIMGMLLGETILRGWFWVRQMHIGTQSIGDLLHGYPITPAGKIIEMIGALCLIRVFAPDHWSRMTWIVVGIMAVVIAAVAAFGW